MGCPCSLVFFATPSTLGNDSLAGLVLLCQFQLLSLDGLDWIGRCRLGFDVVQSAVQALGDLFHAAEILLSDKGIALPDSPGKALRSLIVESALLKIRGLGFRLSENSFASPEILDRIDLLWSAGTALSMIDPIAAHVFRLKGLRTALGSGDPKRIAFGLASYATILSYSGTSKSRQVARLRQQAEELARRCGDPHTLAMHSFMGGFIDFHFMRLKAARRQFEEAEAIFASQCRDVIWQSDT
jgi:hypothetical protein